MEFPEMDEVKNDCSILSAYIWVHCQPFLCGCSRSMSEQHIVNFGHTKYKEDKLSSCFMLQPLAIWKSSAMRMENDGSFVEMAYYSTIEGQN